nr:hypothetical protein MarFTME_001 [Marseillevirus futianmevirus]
MCYITKTSQGKLFVLHLAFCSPWKHKDEITPIPKKVGLLFLGLLSFYILQNINSLERVRYRL